MQPLSTSPMNMALVLPLPREIHLCRSSSNVPHLPSFWICYKTFTLWAGCRIPCACHAKPHTYKSGPSPSVFYSRCASRHNGVRFFDISTLKSAPKLSALTLLTSKCASHHNAVQFFISHLARWLRTRRFSNPTFRPS